MKTFPPHARRTRFAVAISLALGTALPAVAQTAPDAGRLLQEATPPLQAPKPVAVPHIEAPALTDAAPGGVQVRVTSVEITGATVFTPARLAEVLGDVKGRSLDLSALRELANRLSAFYREAGYPFARAYVPAQDMGTGVLRIDIVEGRYGDVQARGDARFVAAAAPFLAPLHSGDVIASDPLERTTMVMSDLPGVHVTPILRPGAATGSGDLEVQLDRTAPFDGEVGIDNFGDRYTGQYRVRFDLNANSPFLLGDQIALHSMVTSENMWFGSLGYSAALGGSGLRAQASVAHTYYHLGGEFANLDGTGTADVTSAGLSYPLVRSQARNLSLSASFVHKELLDRQGAAGTRSAKSSNTVPVALNFDFRDALGGGGLSYGMVSVTPGHLDLDDGLAAIDASTARTRGNFAKINVDAARIQAVGGAVSLYGHVAAQWSSKNLDSSETFGLGGASGVRAYPEGEAYGDEGLLGQVEVRYAAGAFAPYAFFDAGKERTNANAWVAGKNTRSLGGVGIGARYTQDRWSADAALATRTFGGKPQSDGRDFRPAAWISCAYRF
jgi:hemolysin activation/secretion protein